MGFLPTLFVKDVEASSRWYQELFDVRSGHGGPEFEMLVVGEHDIVLQLHKAELEEHGTRIQPGSPNGLGVLLYFQVADVDAVRATHQRAVGMGATVEGEPWHNELAHHTEFVVRDPDGYAVAVHSPFAP
jgi:catechol 2,3-dioxygenase-like lactoylglutathione lyase family enzyme